MYTNQIVAFLFGLAAAGSLIYGMSLILAATQQKKTGRQWTRALRIGVAAWLFAVFALTAVDVWSAPSPVNARYASTFLWSLTCLSPLGIAGFIGGFVQLNFIKYLRAKQVDRD